MKVLFLNPPFKTEYGRFSRTSRSPAVTKSGTIYYPIWLAYAAAVTEAAGHEIMVIDSCAERINLELTMERIKGFNPEMAVIDTSTPSIYADIEAAAAIKKMFPQCFVTLMGTHPSALPEETLGFNKAIDAIAMQEADYIVRDLANGIPNLNKDKLFNDEAYRDEFLSQQLGLAYRLGDQIKVNKHRPYIEDLDEIPFVSQLYKKHLDVRKYFFAACDYPEVQIMTSRGCIAKCTFCVYPQTIHGGKYRMRSPENIANEFEWITKNMPEVREVGIEDDVFTGGQKRVVDFCKIMIERKIKLKWYCNVRVDLKYETMEWMRKAGCVLVTVGYESADEQVMKNIDKRATPQMNLEFSRNTKKAGLMVHGCFMAGNNGDTRATLEKSLDLALQMNDDTMQFFPLMVYPGTKDYERAKREGLLTIKDYSEYVTEDGNHNSVLRMPDMDSNEIREWCNYARRRYYLRKEYIKMKLIQQFTRPSEIRRTVKATKRFVRFLVPSRSP